MGYVQSALWFPCAKPDPFLLLQAGAYALAPVLISALTVGCRDIIKMRAGQSPWHGRHIKALINGVTKASEADRFNKIFKFALPLEKLFFVWFVADLTIEFIARWHSQAFSLGACGDFPDVCEWSGTLASFVVPAPGAWVYIAYQRQSVSGPCSTSGGIEFAVPKGHYWQATFSVTAEPIGRGGPIGNVQTRLVKSSPYPHEFQARTHTPDWFANKVHAISHYQRTEPEQEFAIYRFEGSADNPAVGTGGSCNVRTGPYPVMDNSFIPTNCLGGPAPFSLAPYVDPFTTNPTRTT